MKLILVFGMALMMVVGTCAAALGQKPPCDPPVNDGHDAQVHVVVVDRTSARNPQFIEGIEARMSAAFQPNVRAMLWAFGGRDPLPQLLKDIVTPRLPRDDIVDINVLADRMFGMHGEPAERKKCILVRVQEHRAEFMAALRTEVQTLDPSEGRVSPILLAVDQAVQPVAREAARGAVDLLLLSDGFEHSDHLTLYPVRGRYPSVAEVSAKSKSMSGTWKGARVTIAGLGVAKDGGDPASVVALLAIWRAILIERRAVPVELSTSAPRRLGS